MKIKVETEEKYYCINPKKIISIIEDLGFKEIGTKYESDEYFTDIESQFIKDRTCLRIRKMSDDKMEITFKGKSNSLLGQYCKLENNISANINEYENFVSLFTSLGYYSYVIVEKERITYEKKDDNYKYSIMIDKLPEIGGFVEFEIISEQSNSSKADLKNTLRNFVNKFSELNLTAELKPYRDVVADNIYKQLFRKKEITDVYLNIDQELLKYEKDFFKKYKHELSKKLGTTVKIGTYRKSKNINSILAPFVDDYLENLIFDSKELFVAISLLQKLNYRKHFITKVNEVFFTHFFGKLNIKIGDVIYYDDNNLSQLLKKEGVDLSKSIVLNNKDMKEINSCLLIIINSND